MIFETTKFCFYCGHGPVELLEYKGNSYSCSICQAIFLIDGIKDPQLTLEEAQAAFDQIPLTDHQATGRANKGKWARKRN